MIEVRQLTKKYDSFTALDRISFEIKKGEVVGLLGPNGAGKSTTLRILTCFIPPSDGEVFISGYNVKRDSLRIRRLIGYLPENNPIYPEMRVREFLRYRAALKKVPRHEIQSRIDLCLDQCRLKVAGNKIIGTLSKGMRQRVGLAEAMIHDPEILILDEPTLGLDPLQVRQLRNLISELGKERTVLLSSHILPEVEATCSRVIILNKGKVVSIDSPENLASGLSRGSRLRLEVKAPFEESRACLSQIPFVSQCRGEPLGGVEWNRFELQIEEGRDLREEVFRLVVAKGWGLRELKGAGQTLEDVFVHLTTEENSQQ